MENGDQIKIWKYKWIPNPSTYKIQPPIQILQEHAMVKKLMDADQRDWNQDLIHKIFNTQEARTICCLPIGRGRAMDKMVWRPTTNGMFIVKFVYHLELNRIKNLNGESSSSGIDNKYWKTI